MLPIGAGGVTRQTQQVQKAFDRLSETSVKLATLKRINRGSDDPAGMIGAEELKREIRALDEASKAAERNRSFVRTADSALGQAGDLLNQIEGNLVAAANEALSPAERDAIQIEIDAAIDAIDRIGNTTSFGGRKVFDGQPTKLLTGPNPADQAELDLPEVDSAALGSTEGKLADLRGGGSASDDPDKAVDIVRGARQQVLSARAEAGAFERNTIDATQRLFEDTAANLSSSLSQIEDADVAVESANLVRSIILSDTAVATARLSIAAHKAQAGLLDDLLEVLA